MRALLLYVVCCGPGARALGLPLRLSASPPKPRSAIVSVTRSAGLLHAGKPLSDFVRSRDFLNEFVPFDYLLSAEPSVAEWETVETSTHEGVGSILDSSSLSLSPSTSTSTSTSTFDDLTTSPTTVFFDRLLSFLLNSMDSLGSMLESIAIRSRWPMDKPTLKGDDSDAGAHQPTSILHDQEQVAPSMSMEYDYQGGHIQRASAQPSRLGQPSLRLGGTGNPKVLQAVFHLPEWEVDHARTLAHDKSLSLAEPNLTISPAGYCPGTYKFNTALGSLWSAAVSVTALVSGATYVKTGTWIALLLLPTCGAVTCPICQDTISGCTGADACPLVTDARANERIISERRMGAPLKITNLLTPELAAHF